MEHNNTGSTTIAPTVLNAIARLTALETPGVSRMSSQPSCRYKKTLRNDLEGVQVVVKDSKLFMDVYVITTSDVNVRSVAENVQNRVRRAISETVGMDVAQINVHIADVDIEA